MDFHSKDLNKNKIIIPILFVMLAIAVYAANELSKTMKPMTLEEYESRYTVPEFPKPVNQR